MRSVDLCHHFTTVCIIPARYGSTRLPAKMLREIDGVPLIVWTYRNALDSGAFDAVIVAADDLRIRDAVVAHGGRAVMTSAHHQSGTDRIHEAAATLDCKYLVNLQGDEPNLPHGLLRDFTAALQGMDGFSLLTTVSDATLEEMSNPNVVKVVLTVGNEALYFSRSPIPFGRDGVPDVRYRHTGLYGFSKEGLDRFCALPQGRLEAIEKLEQLRALEHGMKIRCLVRQYRSLGIDTLEDFSAFETWVRQRRME